MGILDNNRAIELPPDEEQNPIPGMAAAMQQDPNAVAAAPSPDISALINNTYLKQMQDIDKTPALAPPVAMNYQEFMDKYNKAKEDDSNAKVLNALGQAGVMFGNARNSGGHLAPDLSFVNSLSQVGVAPKQLEQEANIRNTLDEAQRQNELLGVKQNKEKRQEVRDIGKSLLDKQKEEHQEDRDDEKLDNEGKKLGLEALKTDSEVTAQDARTKLIQAETSKANLMLKDDAQTRNPNSPVSKIATDFYASQLDSAELYDLADQIRNGGFSEQQIKQVLGANNLSNLVTQMNANDLREELKNNELNSKENIAKTKAGTAMEAVTSKTRAEAEKIDKQVGFTRSMSTIDAVKKAMDDPNGIKDIEALFTMMQTVAPNSRLTKDKSALIMSATGPMANIANLPHKFQKGDILNPEQRKAMAQVMQSYVDVNRKQYTQLVGPIIEQAQRTGMDLKSVLPKGYFTDAQPEKIQVVRKSDGKVGMMPKENVEKAIQSGEYELWRGQ